MKKYCVLFLLIALLVTGCAPGEAGEGDMQEPDTGEDQTEEPAEEPAGEPLSAALLTSGPINDGGWNTKAYEGLLLLEDEYGFDISYTENVKQDDQAMIAEEYARKGFDLIIGHGFEFGDPLSMVAPKYPDAYFLNVGGVVGGQHPNLSSGVFETGVLGYLAGRLAADMTETDRIGFVGAMEIPTVVNEVTAIKAATETFNPDAEVTITYTGSWVDIAAGKEAALAQIADGCDFLIAIGDACNAGVIQAAEEQDVWAIGWAGDMNELSPDHVATSFVQSVSSVIEMFASSVVDGSWEGKAMEFGIPSGAQVVGTWAPGVPDESKALVEDEFDRIYSGELDKEGIDELIGLAE